MWLARPPVLTMTCVAQHLWMYGQQTDIFSELTMIFETSESFVIARIVGIWSA
jgi:hypothetical protein